MNPGRGQGLRDLGGPSDQSAESWVGCTARINLVLAAPNAVDVAGEWTRSSDGSTAKENRFQPDRLIPPPQLPEWEECRAHSRRLARAVVPGTKTAARCGHLGAKGCSVQTESERKLGRAVTAEGHARRIVASRPALG